MVRSRFVPILSTSVLLLGVLACNMGAQPGTGPDSPAPTAAAASDTSGGACANPLYPVVVGATWNYSMTGATPGNFVRSITAVNADGFTDQDAFDAGITRTGEWKCHNGDLTALQPDGGSTASVQSSNVEAHFETTSYDGVTLPASVSAGRTWSQNLTLEGTESFNGIEAAAKNATSFDCTAGPVESVTVPAGTFNAQRVDCNVHIAITITMNGADVPANVDSTSSAWYASGVGMVKTQSVVGDIGNSTIELTSYTIP